MRYATMLMLGVLLAATVWLPMQAADDPKADGPVAAGDDVANAEQPPASQPDDAQDDPLPATPVVGRFAGKPIGNVLKIDFPEPSGVTYHPNRKTLFLVGDQGDLMELKTDGSVIRRRMLEGGSFRYDCEGLTVDPSTGLVYVAVEGAEAVLEVDPNKLEVQRTFRIDRVYKGKVVMDAPGNGIEAITFVPDPKRRHGGTFLVANQSFNLNDPREWSAVFEVELPLRDKGEPDPKKPAPILRHFALGVTDLSGMHWDADRRRLYVLSDRNNLLFECNLQGKLYAKHTNVPGHDQEGVTFDENDNMYIAQDSGGLLRFEWKRPEKQKPAPKAADVTKSKD